MTHPIGAVHAFRSAWGVCAAVLLGVSAAPIHAQDHGDHVHLEPAADGRIPVPMVRDIQAEDDVLVIPQFVVEHTSLLPGQQNVIGIWLQIDPDWHIYWPGQNDTGFPMTASWDVSNDKVTISDRWIWPKPTRYTAPGNILDHVYYGHTLVLIPVWVAPDAEGEVAIAAQLDYLVCKDVCLFEHAEIEITLPITSDLAQRRQAATWSVFTRFEGEFPELMRVDATDSRFTVERVSNDDGEDEIVIRVPGARNLAFYPHESGLILADPLGQGIAQGDELRLSISSRQGTAEGEDAGGKLPPLRGMIEAWNQYGGTIVSAFIGAREPERAPWLDADKDESLMSAPASTTPEPSKQPASQPATVGPGADVGSDDDQHHSHDHTHDHEHNHEDGTHRKPHSDRTN